MSTVCYTYTHGGQTMTVIKLTDHNGNQISATLKIDVAHHTSTLSVTYRGQLYVGSVDRRVARIPRVTVLRSINQAMLFAIKL